MVTLPLADPFIALNVALPAFNPVATPAASIEATDGLSDDQVRGASFLGSPLANRGWAFNFIVPPTSSGVVAGSTSIFATGACFTVTLAKTGLPSTSAITVTSPG